MERLGKLWVLWIAALAIAAGGWGRPVSAQTGGEAVVLTVDGPLTPALTTYIERSMAQAQREEAAPVILQLNTPGGQIDLMDDMVAVIRNSRTPVVVFVAPRGAIAGSAGTVITLAGHASAMAPETAIGAARPVGGQGENLGSTLESKLKEVLKAKVRALAANRPPEAIALAEATIETAKAATAEEAHAAGLVDFLAADVPDLLNQMDGFPVGGNGGGWVAVFMGAVSLALAFYGLGVLPVNWFGIIFIVIAFALFILDINAPTHGALTAAGAGSLIVGALVLFNSSSTPDYFRVSVPLVVGTSLVLAAGFSALLIFALRAQYRPVVVGVESLIGQEGEARGPNSVQVAGELWSAEAEEGALEAGQRVIVTAVKGLKVVVRKREATVAKKRRPTYFG